MGGRVKLSTISDFFKKSDDGTIFKKSENAYESKHVLSVNFDAEIGYCSAKVHASQRSKTYDVQIWLSNKEIEKVFCDCPRGLVACHHVGAVLLFIHYNVSCTDLACKWITPTSTSTIKIGSNISEIYPIKKPFSAIKKKQLQELKPAFKNKLRNLENVINFSWILKDEPLLDITTNKVESFIFSTEFEEAIDKQSSLEKNLKLDEKEIEIIEQKTRGQRENPLWQSERKFRITASNFGRVLDAVERRRFPPSLFRTLLGDYNLEGVHAIVWGRSNEKSAIMKFEELSGWKVTECGLFVSSCGMLAASPDGLINDCSATVEVKCPYTYRAESVEALLKKKEGLFYYENNKLVINRSHHHYHQIQAQMYLSNKQLAYYVVWTTIDCYFWEVARDKEWEKNMNILRKFFIDVFIPYCSAVSSSLSGN